MRMLDFFLSHETYCFSFTHKTIYIAMIEYFSVFGETIYLLISATTHDNSQQNVIIIILRNRAEQKENANQP